MKYNKNDGDSDAKEAHQKAHAKKRDMAKKMKGNKSSEGGIPFGKAPKGEK